MSCPRNDQKWLEYLDGALSADEQRALDEHIATCQGCAERLRQYQRSWDALGELSAPVVPGGLKKRVLAVVAAERAPTVAAPERRGSPWRWAWAPLAAAAVVLVVVGVVALRGPGTGGGDLSAEDRMLALNYDVIENLELLENLDLLKVDEWEDLEALADTDLDALAEIVDDI